MSKRVSRYVLGHLGFADLAKMPVGAVGYLILNPEEPNARFEASKSLKAAFYKAGKNCVLNSQTLLIQVEPTVWKQSQMLSITCTERDGGAA